MCLVAQLCPTLCDLMDCSLPDSSVLGILQVRILEWVVMLFSRGSAQPRDPTQSSTLQVDSLPAELPVKPRFATRCLDNYLDSIKSHKLRARSHKTPPSPLL